MKVFQLLLVAILLFTTVGMALAEGPYVGDYPCLGEPQTGCGLGDIQIYPPYRIKVTKEGDTYKMCLYYRGYEGSQINHCISADLSFGQYEWTLERELDGVNIAGDHKVTFSGSSIDYKEHGMTYGRYSCDFQLKALCTK